MVFFIIVIDCSQITPLLCGIQNLTAVLTPIILGLLQKKTFRGYCNFLSFFGYKAKKKVCIVSLLCKVLVCKQAPVKDEKKNVRRLSKCSMYFSFDFEFILLIGLGIPKGVF